MANMFQNLKIAREIWNFVNEIINSEKTRTAIPRLDKSFGTVLSNAENFANLLNYKISASGKYFVEKEHYQFCKNAARHSNKFIFKYTTSKQIFDILNNLNVKKLLGPSFIPAWALKDANEHIAEFLCFWFNQFLTDQLLSNDIKRAHVLPLLKKDDPEYPINYRSFSLTRALAKLL